MDKEQFYELLDDFYTDVVENQYGYHNVERVCIGDTRHFVFCNMMLQGFNMLSIARMGGHLNLKSQLTYTSHLDYFADARVKILSEQIKRSRNQSMGNTESFDMNGLMLRSKLNNNSSALPVENGFCHDANFPNRCIDECIYCNSFTLDTTNPGTLKELALKSSKISQNIKEQIQTMQRVSQDMFYDIETLQYSPEDQEKLSTLAKKLNELFSQQALLNFHLQDSNPIPHDAKNI